MLAMLPTQLAGHTPCALKHRTSLSSDCSPHLKNSSAPASCKNVAARRNSWVRLRVVPGDGDYDADWDHHGSVFTALPQKCQQVDKPMAALERDLKERGLLDETSEGG